MKSNYCEMLYKCGGNRTKAAQLMGISRRTLHRKLLKWPELGSELFLEIYLESETIINICIFDEIIIY